MQACMCRIVLEHSAIMPVNFHASMHMANGCDKSSFMSCNALQQQETGLAQIQVGNSSNMRQEGGCQS